MKITAIRATPVSARTTRSNAWSLGKGTGFSRTIIEIDTDEGITGVGEAPRGDTAEVINSYFAPRLIGHDPGEWQTARLRCLPRNRDWGLIGDARERMAFGGVDMALWDIMGKAAGRPLFRLLGGPVRETAPFVAYAYSVDTAEGFTEAQVPAQMAAVARRSIAETGASVFEFKVGRNSVDCEIETVRAIREELGPAIGLSLDANMGYTIGEARRLIAGIVDVGILNFEEPVASLGEMQMLRAEFGVPMSTHCTNFEALQHYPLIDSVVGDFHHEAGIAPTLALAAVARAHHRQFWLHTYQELGISWAARCHFGMACPEASHPAQALINWVVDDLILGEPWRVQDGGFRPPEKPGLGVELDPDGFARAAESYRTEGELAYLVAR
jgi:glucarate dehydratase